MVIVKITQSQYIVKTPTMLDKILPWRSSDEVEVLNYENILVSTTSNRPRFGEVNQAFIWATEFTDAPIITSIEIADKIMDSASVTLHSPLIIETRNGDIKRILKVEMIKG
ncbi:hypothetical protein KARL1_231 [Acinetobacter phage KARL-1]|uniref:Uncharacterized protein n=1 Tax=Acinetobacter phage KARL-1 TaxID=2301662 RepID=A0A385IIY9_9CAUD|nr:hypothetical protein HYP70_gp231 [Acinetobacter phage KARL-1]AXY82850.1 hypothetical protein KARL1_231 [Acinetobacter phage KARL-1]